MFRLKRNGIRIIIKILKLKRKKPGQKNIKSKARLVNLYLLHIDDRDVSILIGETVLRAICVHIAMISSPIQLK